jgi:hypothetical protein
LFRPSGWGVACGTEVRTFEDGSTSEGRIRLHDVAVSFSLFLLGGMAFDFVGRTFPPVFLIRYSKIISRLYHQLSDGKRNSEENSNGKCKRRF